MVRSVRVCAASIKGVIELTWIPYTIIALGVLMLLVIPVLVHIIRTDPMQVVRSVWHETLTPEHARVVGVIVVIIALIGGLWAISKGMSLL